ncbi:hypothetical protein [Myceligenerans pegani]|uniref:Uncharacterized protein n=1 Tax=Myceligenerans pegani TaxID=2776917 RepID=A0ABR9N212_9MICO|nr:hypothetical protein [Myceligenerans sp. TRM 65318]MBE1877695.1 hypothetical protein [Myceligenerans sp. TRM 65318]MBE3019966.1 hypothetical protein [Myceligenerans sp. TRM 65318]
MDAGSSTVGRRAVLRAAALMSATVAVGAPFGSDAVAAEGSGGGGLALEEIVPPDVMPSGGAARQAVPHVLGVRIRTGPRLVAAGSQVRFRCDVKGYDFSSGTAILAHGQTGVVTEVPLVVADGEARVVLDDGLQEGSTYALLAASAVGEHFMDARPSPGRTVQAELAEPDGGRIAKKVLSRTTPGASAPEWKAAVALSVTGAGADGVIAWMAVSAVGAAPVPAGTDVMVLGTSAMNLTVVDGTLPGREDVAPRFSDSGARAAVRLRPVGGGRCATWRVTLSERIPARSSLVVPLRLDGSDLPEGLSLMADLKPRAQKSAWRTSGAESTEPVMPASVLGAPA